MFRYALLLILAATSASAQSLSGVVNAYTRLTGYTQATCKTELAVETSSPFTVGDRVVIIQMSGVAVDLSLTPNYGSYTDLRSAGRFQFATVTDVRPGTLTIREPLLYAYSVAHNVQVVRVASGARLTVNGPVLSPPWNGSEGGVIAIEATTSLTLNAPIDATGAGCVGGVLIPGDRTCSVRDLAAADNSPTHARRGSGLFPLVSGQLAGTGAIANGGGGGGGSNAGGGGGAGVGAGGRGGDQWIGCGRGLNNGGLGGWPLPMPAADVRLYLGGGGGAGHQNNDVGTPGARGGGIVIIRTPTLNGNGYRIMANGADVQAEAQFDGAGGGGGGGTLLIDVPVINNTTFEAHGGSGGSVRYVDRHGPGGGGGGGSILCTSATLPAGVYAFVWGATHGVNILAPPGPDQPFGAFDGLDGVVVLGASYLVDTTRPLTNAMVRSVQGCSGDSLFVTARPDGGTPPYQVVWLRSDGSEEGGSLTLETQADPPSIRIARLTDARGCERMDTVRIDHAPTASVVVDTLDLGSVSTCDFPIDTVITITNTSNRSCRITAITAPSGLQVLDPPAPFTLAGSERRQVRVRLVGGAASPISVIILASDGCDTSITAIIRWSSASENASFSPSPLLWTEEWVCDSTAALSTAAITYRGAASMLESVITEGTLSVQVTAPRALKDGDVIAVGRRWTSAGPHSGRVGFVVRLSNCVDTLWVEIADTVRLALAQIEPDAVVFRGLVTCDTTADLESVVVRYTGTSGTIEDLVIEGTVRAGLGTPLPVTDGQEITIQRPWAGYGLSRGRIGLVVSYAACIDTLWIAVEDTVKRPVIRATPVDLGTVVLCRDTMLSGSSVITTSATNPQIIVRGVQTTPGIECSLQPGEMVLSGDVVTFTVRPTLTGTFQGVIGIHVADCDTVIEIGVSAEVVDADADATAVLTYNQRAPNSTEVLRSEYVNRGTSNLVLTDVRGPQAPFRIVSMRSALPATIIPGDAFWVDVEYRVSTGTNLDSVVFVVTEPCTSIHTTELRSDAVCQTHVVIPNATAAVGTITEIPVVVEQHPFAPADAPIGFDLRVRLDASTAEFLEAVYALPGGSSAMRDGPEVVISVTGMWTGNDTLVLLRLMPLLTTDLLVPIRFDTVLAFQWHDLSCEITTQQGLLVLNDVCGGPLRTSLVFTGTIRNISVSPNPATESVQLSVVCSQPTPTRADVVDLYGTIVRSISIDVSGTATLDVSNMASGTYRLVVRTPTERRDAVVVVMH